MPNKSNKSKVTRITNPFVSFFLDLFGSTMGLIAMMFSFYLMGVNLLGFMPKIF